jgi:hypothetical protein
MLRAYVLPLMCFKSLKYSRVSLNRSWLGTIEQFHNFKVLFSKGSEVFYRSLELRCFFNFY